MERGKASYAKRCSQCHGDTGKADGPAALFMLPRPRVLANNGVYKFRSTASGELPTDQDLFNTITHGIPGTAMPAFKAAPEQERWDLVAFVKSLTEDFKDPDMVKTSLTMPELVAPHPLASSEQSRGRGKELFESNKCWQCHGHAGRGNGPSWKELKDAWVNPILPANLANPETFRGGSSSADVYRAFTTGLSGTPMPAYAESITPEDRWHLVNYVLSFGPAPRAQPDEKIDAVQVDKLPALDDAAAWSKVPQARFRTVANVIEPPRLFWPSVDFIMAQAMYTDRQIALRIQWDDRSQATGNKVEVPYSDRDTAIYINTEHPDQLAVQMPAQLSGGRARPYVLFGDAKRPACLWWWRSDRNKLLEMNSKGSASIAYQDPDSQELSGKVTYDDGRYTMVVSRTLTTADTKNDPQLSPGAFVPIAFHVWDGGRGELGNRHALTTWYWLFLQPPVPPESMMLPPVVFVGTLGLLSGLVFLVRRREKRS